MQQISPILDMHKLDLSTRNITADSRQIQQGDIFVAIKGEMQDGHDYIHKAIMAGAQIIIMQKGTMVDMNTQVQFYETENTRKAYAQLIGLKYAKAPALKLAITGTNGKSSTAGFAAQLLQLEHVPTLILGTLGAFLDGKKLTNSLTTPDPKDLHLLLEQAVSAGAKAVALEASSHGLSQYRLDSLTFDIAAFTNLSQDHLDYHHDMEQYFQAKLRLFSHLLKPDGHGVIFNDDAYAKPIMELLHKRNIAYTSYGYDAKAHAQICQIDAHHTGQDVRLQYDGRQIDFHLPLIGKFQVENALAAALMVIHAGYAPQKIFDNLAKLQGIAGRMEFVGTTAKGGSVFVDFAHTPQGLAVMLQNARIHCHDGAKLAVLFGAGGDRDATKRPLMGKAAHDYADIQYVSDDNPRFEDPAEIRKQVLTGAPNAVEIGDRAVAIAQAMDALNAGDILIIAGKGHEEGQSIKGETIPFNDKIIATNYL